MCLKSYNYHIFFTLGQIWSSNGLRKKVVVFFFLSFRDNAAIFSPSRYKAGVNCSDPFYVLLNAFRLNNNNVSFGLGGQKNLKSSFVEKTFSKIEWEDWCHILACLSNNVLMVFSNSFWMPFLKYLAIEVMLLWLFKILIWGLKICFHSNY
jgi:hypothetical protein